MESLLGHRPAISLEGFDTSTCEVELLTESSSGQGDSETTTIDVDVPIIYIEEDGTIPEDFSTEMPSSSGNEDKTPKRSSSSRTSYSKAAGYTHWNEDSSGRLPKEEKENTFIEKILDKQALVLKEITSDFLKGINNILKANVKKPKKKEMRFSSESENSSSE